MRWNGVISAPESVVGTAAQPKAVGAGDRLRRVDHPAAAERDQRPPADVAAHGRGSLGHRARRHVERRQPRRRPAPGAEPSARSVVSSA